MVIYRLQQLVKVDDLFFVWQRRVYFLCRRYDKDDFSDFTHTTDMDLGISGADTELCWARYVNTMAADVFVPYVMKSTAVMTFKVRFFAFLGNGFQIHATFQYCEMMRNANICWCIPMIILGVKIISSEKSSWSNKFIAYNLTHVWWNMCDICSFWMT